MSSMAKKISGITDYPTSLFKEFAAGIYPG